MKYDTIIRGGTVIDGTRLPRFRADVGIRNGKIARIGRIPAGVACDRELDATGCYVTPGFVDLHCHYDAQIHWDPWCTISGWLGASLKSMASTRLRFAQGLEQRPPIDLAVRVRRHLVDPDQARRQHVRRHARLKPGQDRRIRHALLAGEADN